MKGTQLAILAAVGALLLYFLSKSSAVATPAKISGQTGAGVTPLTGIAALTSGIASLFSGAASATHTATASDIAAGAPAGSQVPNAPDSNVVEVYDPASNSYQAIDLSTPAGQQQYANALQNGEVTSTGLPQVGASTSEIAPGSTLQNPPANYSDLSDFSPSLSPASTVDTSTIPTDNVAGSTDAFSFSDDSLSDI